MGALRAHRQVPLQSEQACCAGGHPLCRRRYPSAAFRSRDGHTRVRFCGLGFALLPGVCFQKTNCVAPCPIRQFEAARLINMRALIDTFDLVEQTLARSILSPNISSCVAETVRWISLRTRSRQAKPRLARLCCQSPRSLGGWMGCRVPRSDSRPPVVGSKQLAVSIQVRRCPMNRESQDRIAP